MRSIKDISNSQGLLFTPAVGSDGCGYGSGGKLHDFWNFLNLQWKQLLKLIYWK